jgi:cytochrome c oxidase cbb3-type subunit 3
MRNMRVSIAIMVAAGAVYAQNQPARAPNPNPFAANPQAVADGRELYNRTCTGCHGYDGTVGERGPALGASGRRYLKTSDQDLFDAIRKGIPGTPMPATGLAETDAWKVAAYIRSLRGTAIDAPAPGDVAHGEQIFWGKGACSECHMLRGRGGLLGPDLSNLAGRRKLYSIRDALTKTEHVAATDGGRHELSLTPLNTYRAVSVVTRDGKTFSGVLMNEENFSIQIMGSDNELHMFARDELREVVYEPKSLMPTDYDKRLTPEEFQDLLAFLSHQAVAGRKQ